MNGLIALALLAASPVASEPLEDAVDLVELNHIFDTQGNPHFDQFVFWSWNGQRYEVVAWRQAKSADQWPRWDFARRRYTAIWDDGGTLRKVTAPAMRETWTQLDWDGDPEIRDRELLPVEQRRELRPAPKRPPFVREIPAGQ